MSTTFPDRDSDLLAWSVNFLAGIGGAPTTLGLTEAMVNSYESVHNEFAGMMQACDPSVRSKTAVVNKNDAKAALKSEARLLINVINGQKDVSDGQKTALGIAVRKKPSPMPEPGTPRFEVKNVVGWTVFANISAPGGTGRGKGVGSVGTTVLSHVGPTPPASVTDWKFEFNTGKTDVEITFDSSLPIGTTVWLTAFFFNGRKESGLASTPVSTRLQGGQVQLVKDEPASKAA